jgi:hypothetical protein
LPRGKVYVARDTYRKLSNVTCHRPTLEGNIIMHYRYRTYLTTYRIYIRIDADQHFHRSPSQFTRRVQNSLEVERGVDVEEALAGDGEFDLPRLLAVAVEDDVLRREACVKGHLDLQAADGHRPAATSRPQQAQDL